MTDGIQGQAEICRQVGGSHLSTQLFLGISRRTKGVLDVAVQTAGMASPMPQLMQCSRIVSGQLLEGSLRRQMNFIRRRPIKGTICLVMLNNCSAEAQHLFGEFQRLFMRVALFLRHIRRQRLFTEDAPDKGLTVSSNLRCTVFFLYWLHDLLPILVQHRHPLNHIRRMEHR